MKKGKRKTLNQFTVEETFEEDQPEILSEHVHERPIIKDQSAKYSQKLPTQRFRVKIHLSLLVRRRR